MARPRLHDEPRVSTQIRLPEDLHQRLKLAARDRDVSVNLIVTRALVEYLDRLEPADVVLSTARPRSR
jgi:predicted HicB family RNase H-like nuclease